MIEPNKMMANFRASDDRIAELKRERDVLAAQLAVAAGALGEVDDLIAKSKPLSGYLAAARTEIALALASLPERAEALREVAEAANELRTKGWTMTRENALYEAVAKLKETP